MAVVHQKKHGIISADDHVPGSTASPGKFNVVGTDDQGALGELPVEAIDQSTPVRGEIVRRGTGGQILLPLNNAAGRQAISYEQALDLAGNGPWWGSVIGAYPDRTSPSIVDLAVNDAIIETNSNKIFKVLELTNGSTGATVTWDTGWLPDRDVIVLNTGTGSEWMYSVANDEWRDMGSSGHPREHNIVSSADHIVTSNQYGILYTMNDGTKGVVSVLQMVDESTGTSNVAVGSPLISAGNGLPIFGQLRIAATIPLAGDTEPTMADLSTMANNTIAVVRVTATQSVYFCFKQDGTTGYAVEATKMQA